MGILFCNSAATNDGATQRGIQIIKRPTEKNKEVNGFSSVHKMQLIRNTKKQMRWSERAKKKELLW